VISFVCLDQEDGKVTGYRADIDGLRAIAVMLVLVFHFDLFSLGKAGFIGVDVFFVISGFLITSIIKKQLDNNTFSLKNFYIKRVRRLAPPLVAVLLLTLLVGSFILLPTEFKELTTQVFFSQLYIANIFFWQSVNYFGLHADGVFLLHTWSLAVEEQFYLLYPLGLLFVYRYLKVMFWPAIIFLLLASFLLNIAFVESKPEATFYLLPMRAWELLLGGIIPLVNVKVSRPKFVDQILGVLGFVCIFLSVFLYQKNTVFPGYFALFPTLGAALCIIAGTNYKTFSSSLLSFSPAVYIGRISYSLYLVHWPIIVFAVVYLGDDYTMLWRWITFFLSIVFAVVIYHVIENPIRHKKILSSDKIFIASYGIIICASVGLYVLSNSTGGFPARFSSEVVALADKVNDKNPPLSECEYSKANRLNSESYCKIGSNTSSPTWFIYGDSHAWAAYKVFDEWLKARNESAYFAFQHSCPPVKNIYLLGRQGLCFEFNQSVSEYIDTHQDIDKVFLVSTWVQGKKGIFPDRKGASLSQSQTQSLFHEQFTNTVSNYHVKGKGVYVWEPLPGAKANVPKTLARAKIRGEGHDLEVSESVYRGNYNFFFEALNQNNQYITNTFSTSEALCQSGNCAVLFNGTPLYSDSSHLAASPFGFWVDNLDRQIPSMQ